MNNIYTNKEMESDIIEDFNSFPFVERQILREKAEKKLRSEGFEDVGESEIKKALVRLYREFGNFEMFLEIELVSAEGFRYHEL
jgi:hypothetical protein